MQQNVYKGFGSIEKLNQIIQAKKYKRIFLIYDKNSYAISGAEKEIKRLLDGFEVESFCEFSPNPKIEDVISGIKRIKDSKYDAIVTIGGGSVMDMGKLINTLAVQPGLPIEYIKKEKEIKNKGIPSIAIPTTAGTGSEATHFAVVYVDGVKYSLAHKYVLPNYCILDPQFTLNLPKYVTACTAMDAFSQAIEAYWSVNSTEESKGYSEKAISLFLGSVSNVVSSLPKKKDREKMLLASHYAGKAINIAKTTAPHALSYKLTSLLNIPHGHAVGLSLSKFLFYNSEVTAEDCNDKRGVNYVKKTMRGLFDILGCNNSTEAFALINKIVSLMGLENDLNRLGILKEHLNEIVNSVNNERLKNNPRTIEKKDLLKLMINT